MAHRSLILLLLISIISPCFHGISGVEYQVTVKVPDTPGGKRWIEEVGIQLAKELMREYNEFIWSNIFLQNTPETRKPIDTVELLVVTNDTSDGWVENNIMYFSANYFPSKGRVLTYFKESLYCEMTIVFQWNGEGKLPEYLQTGICWFTAIKAKQFPDSFPEPGDGDKWDEGFYVTARFLEYCDEVTPGFVAKLNEKLKKTYDESFFKELTGKSVDELWKDYKSKHPE